MTKRVRFADKRYRNISHDIVFRFKIPFDTLQTFLRLIYAHHKTIVEKNIDVRYSFQIYKEVYFVV